MGSRSGRRLSTAEKKANRKQRNKLERQRFCIHPSPLPQFKYREYYAVIKDYIATFLKDNKESDERISTRINTGLLYAVIGLVAPHHVLAVNIIEFEGDTVKIEITVQNRFAGTNHFVVRNTHLCVYNRSLSDPKMMDDLDTFLKSTLGTLRRLRNP
jgi:hypothetical protein